MEPCCKGSRLLRLGWGTYYVLDEDTPARKALNKFIQPQYQWKKVENAWFNIIKMDLLKNNNLRINYKNNTTIMGYLNIICSDKKQWKTEVRYMMLNAKDM